MTGVGPEDEEWFDEAAGRLVRPYTVSGGRTRPTNQLNLLSLVKATGLLGQGQLDPDHAQALGLCSDPASVAEIAARLKLPVVVTKVLVSDLLDCGAVTTRHSAPSIDPSTDRFVLEAVLDGLQRRL